LVSNNYSLSKSNHDKNFKFLEILNENFNYAQQKGLFRDIDIHLTKDEVRFNQKDDKSKEKSNAKNYLM